jgi:Rad3-related DNA helicase
VYIGPYLKNLIWDQIESGIFLSATLAFGKGNFSFMKNAIGLNGLDIEEFMCDSPFNFKSQCGLIVPEGVEEPTANNDKELQRISEKLNPTETQQLNSLNPSSLNQEPITGNPAPNIPNSFIPNPR